MNNESSEASAQPPEPASTAKSNEPNPTNSAPDPQPPAAESSADVPPAASDAADQAAQASEPASSEPASSAGGQPVGAARSKIQIGSRRDRLDTTPRSSKPELAGADKAMQEASKPVPRGPVPTPSVRDPLSADLEEQFAAAMSDVSLDEMLTSGLAEASAAPIEMESRHKTVVERIHGDNVFFSLGGRNEGVASLRQFSEPPALGAELEVIVKRFLADDGIYEVVIPGASTHVEDWSDLVEGTVVEARITGANTGGLECMVGTMRGFIPASQVAIYRVEDFSEFVDQKLQCVVTEANPQRRNLVLSHRAIMEREKEEAREKLLETLKEGQTVDGIVRKLMDFGAFVDIGGIDGLVHISQLSWDRVNHPSEILSEGQKVQVKIEKIDKQAGKIGLSYRDLLEHPWLNVGEKFPVESVHKGTVTRTAKFGAFVKLAPGIEGLVHISELSYSRVSNVAAVVSEGQQVDVKVVSIDTDAQRIALSMKAVLPQPMDEPEDTSEAEAALEAQRAQLAAQRTKPLKGGTGRDSGGNQFGLKW